MDDNPLFDGSAPPLGDPERSLYAGAKNELNDLRKSIAEENLAAAAGEKARRQRILTWSIFFGILVLAAAYAIVQILAK